MGCLWQFYKAFSVLFFTLFLVLLLVGVFLLAGIGAVEIPGLSRLFGFGAEPTPTPSVIDRKRGYADRTSLPQDNVQ